VKSKLLARAAAFGLLFSQAAIAAPYKLVWQQVGGGAGKATSTINIDTSNPAAKNGGFFPAALPAWINGGSNVQLNVTGTSNNGTFSFPNLIFTPTAGTFDFTSDIFPQLRDFNLFGAVPATWNGTAPNTLSFGGEQLILISFSGGIGPTPTPVPVVVVPLSTLQPYADVQSITLDALKNQRELLLSQAGECNDRGWVVDLGSDSTSTSAKAKKTRRLCLFVDGQYASSNINQTSSTGSYNATNGTSLYGAEYKLSKQWTIGAAYGYGKSGLGNFNYQFTGASLNADVNSGSLYGVYRPSDQWKISALAGYGDFNYKGSRDYAGESASSRFSSDGYTAALLASYDIRLKTNYNNKDGGANPISLTPLLGIAWGGNQQSSFEESGNGALFGVQANTSNSLIGTIGAAVKAPVVLNAKKKLVLTPRAGIAYQYDFLAGQEKNFTISSTVLGSPGSFLSESGRNRGSNAVYLDLGADLDLSDSVSLFAGVNYQAFTSGDQYAYQGGVKVKF
jgi:hypothetical protein